MLIGMGATVMDGAVIGEGSLVAAGALVTKNTVVPPGTVVMGIPARIKGPVSTAQSEQIKDGALFYRELAEEQLPLWETAAM